MSGAVPHGEEWALDQVREQLAKVDAWQAATGADESGAAGRVFHFGVKGSESQARPYIVLEPADAAAWTSEDGQAFRGEIGVKVRIVAEPAEAGSTGPDEREERRAFVRSCDGIVQGFVDRCRKRSNRLPFVLLRVSRLSGFDLSKAEETEERYDEAQYQIDIGIVR